MYSEEDYLDRLIKRISLLPFPEFLEAMHKEITSLTYKSKSNEDYEKASRFKNVIIQRVTKELDAEEGSSNIELNHLNRSGNILNSYSHTAPVTSKKTTIEDFVREMGFDLTKMINARKDIGGREEK